MDVQRVGVVGAGLMGGGVAEVCARAGLEVAVVEVTTELAAAGRKRVAASLGGRWPRASWAPRIGTPPWAGSRSAPTSTPAPTATWWWRRWWRTRR